MVDKAEAIVDAILEDLLARKGIGNALEEIDDEIMEEMRDDLIDIVGALIR